jgi:AbrB family looped-hinge helix DNA binding protein
MTLVRVRPKGQITIPARIAEEARIKPDDTLEIAYANGVITLVPAARKELANSVMSFAGIARGTWGNTAAEMDAWVEESRASWER